MLCVRKRRRPGAQTGIVIIFTYLHTNTNIIDRCRSRTRAPRVVSHTSLARSRCTMMLTVLSGAPANIINVIEHQHHHYHRPTNLTGVQVYVSNGKNKYASTRAQSRIAFKRMSQRAQMCLSSFAHANKHTH